MNSVMEIARLILAGIAWLVTAGCALAAVCFFVSTISNLKKMYQYRNSNDLKKMDLEAAILTLMMLILSVVFGIAALFVAMALSGGIIV